jgi:hypothetical protein
MRLARRTKAIVRDLTTLALLLFAGACHPAMGATADSALKAVLEGRHAAMKMAMASRNADAVSAVLTVEFVSEDTRSARGRFVRCTIPAIVSFSELARTSRMPNSRGSMP